VHGVRWSRDPLGPPFAVNFVRAQRVLQLSAALPSGRAQARMVPVDFQHAPMPAKLKPKASAQEAKEYAAQKKRLNLNAVAAERVQHLAAQARHRLMAVCDGRFANGRFLRAATSSTQAIITRVRKDSVLYRAPENQPSTGRRRLYGARVATPEQLRRDESVPWQRVRAWASQKRHDFKIKSLGPVRSPLQGEPFCQLIVIAPLGYRLRAQARTLYRQPAYLLCTDAKLSLRQVLQFYLWRWDIEVNFRDEKTLLGVGQAQVRTAESSQRVPAAGVAAYALLLLAADRAYPNASAEASALFPPPRWRRRRPPRVSTSALLDHLRFELFAHALRPQSFTGFWSAPPPNQNPVKLSLNVATALFHLRN
jgi:hypothetical protein